MEKVLRIYIFSIFLILSSFISLLSLGSFPVFAEESQQPIFLDIDKDLDRYYNNTHMNITMRTSISFNESQEYSLFYEVSTIGKVGITGEWIEIQEPMKNMDTTDLKAECIFETGDQNFLRYTVFNSTGFRYDSDVYRIMIDDRGPQITLHSPSEEKWNIQKTVNINFLVEDELSGVDPTSIHYRISTNGFQSGDVSWNHSQCVHYVSF